MSQCLFSLHRARLASLFGLDQTVTGAGNEFFQYTAPKQPKKGQPVTGEQLPKPPPPAATPSVFIATAVQAYRFTNGQYIKQGKYGAAVVGSHVTKEYRILLYINQQQQVAAARIHPGFALTVQPNNFSTFYDDQRQNWSILFESEKAAADFSKQVCIARYNSSPSPDVVLSQDLLLGEGQGVEVGDALEVAFTGWLFQNGGLGQMFDSNINQDKLLRLKLGSGKVIKVGCAALWVPGCGTELGYLGAPHRGWIWPLELRICTLSTNGQTLGSRDTLAPSPGPNPENLTTDPAVLPPSTLPPKPGEPAVRSKSSSISEQLANPDVAKAKLISRMAKMGQPMLPFLPGSAPAQLDSSDSEFEVLPIPDLGTGVPSLCGNRPLKPTCFSLVPQPATSGLQLPSAAIIPAALQTHPALPGTAQSFQSYAGMTYAYPQATAATSQLQPVGAMYPAPFQAAGDIGSFLMTEARQQNTEIRLAVGKVADKVDQLVAKVEELQKQNSGHSLLPGISSVTMETAMIMSNIQRLIQENERLKQEVFEKSGRIEEQNEKIAELIDRSQRYVEQSNLLLEQRNNSLQARTEHTQARVLHAEQEKVKVAEELSAAMAQISRLQLELTDHQKKEMGLRAQLNAALQEEERHGPQLSQLQAQLAELRESSEDARSKFQAEKQNRKQLEGKVAALEEELADLRVEKESLEKNLSERKKKSLMEREQAEEEKDEIRKLYQEELEKLRQLLRKARMSTDQAASEAASEQTELEAQWEAKLARLLSDAKEQHARQYQDVCEQRDAQQQVISQLEEKYVALQSQLAALKAKYKDRIQDLEERAEQPSPAGTSASVPRQVKRIMNAVFQTLRGQFELEETYTGRVVLSVVMNTIKTITLRLLERHQERAESGSGSEEEPQSASAQGPPAATPSLPSDHPEGALEGSQSPLPSDRGPAASALAVPEAQAAEVGSEHRSGIPVETAEPLPPRETPAQEEEAASEQMEARAQDETNPADADTPVPQPSEPTANGPALAVGPEQEEESNPEAPSQDPAGSAPVPATASHQSVAGAQHEPAPSPARGDSRSAQKGGGWRCCWGARVLRCHVPFQRHPRELAFPWWAG
uniref:peptidylprolyl isomerase n=1 Tax=Varanus komodoensis TaxID=61221 RepID=A0A8D2LQB5_VARKO